MKNGIISIFLMLVLLFNLISCNRGAEELPPKDKDLTVEIETVDYTDAGTDRAGEDIADLVAELAVMFGYPALNDEKMTEISELFKTDIIPIIITVPIYENELFGLIDCARECIDISEGEYNADEKLRFISDLYIRFNSILDTKRLGMLIYELQMFSLEASLSRAEERYEKYGYAFYLEDIEYYTQIISDARALGRELFADAVSVFAFMLSASLGTARADGGAITVSAADVFTIMRKQGEKFGSIALTKEQWQTVAAVCEEFIPGKNATGIKGKLLVTLDSDNFFTEAAKIMPELLAFYAALTSDISAENVEIIESNDSHASARVACIEITRNEDAFKELLAAAEDAVPFASDACISAVNAYDKNGYAAFVSEYSATADELYGGIERFASLPTEENYAELERLLIAHAATVNPVVAYVYLYL